MTASELPTGQKGFPIDECFGNNLGRKSLDNLRELNYTDSNGENDLVTFVEFIRGPKKKKSDSFIRNEGFEGLFFFN